MKTNLKKGFTLIELLAVIVVIAIIALIATPIVMKIIKNMRASAELENAKTLVHIADSYAVKRHFNDSTPEEEMFVIIDDVEYQIQEDGTRKKTNKFSHSGELCDYCVVNISSDAKIAILYEGDSQDITKEYNSDELVQKELEQPREVVSLYNDLVLFKDLYVMNNILDGTKNFKTTEDKIFEITPDGQEVEVSKLYHSSGQSKLRLIDENNYKVIITTEETIYEFNSDGTVVESENVNGKFSDAILTLYEELVISAEDYISSNTITGEVYFEFNNGIINEIDKFGNIVDGSNITMHSNLTGSGELRINASNQISVVIYDGDNNIKVDYGSTELYSEPIRYSRDGLTLVKNLARLELLAEQYTGGDKTKADWLVFYYIKDFTYTGTMYDIVTGTDSNFGGDVHDYAPNLETYFGNKTSYTVNNQKIDLRHMAASLAGILYDSPSYAHLAYEELEYDCVVSWAGDLHTLMENSILKNGVKEQYGSYLNATYELMGKSNTSFNMEDVYADLDAWVLAYNIKENTNLSIGEIVDLYYAGESTRSYKNRYSSYISIMNTIATQFNSSKTNFEGVVAHFTNVSRGWATIKSDSLEIRPTTAEQQEIANGFIKWVKDQASKES